MFELGPDLPVRLTANASRTLGEMFWLRASRSASNPALIHKPDGQWRTITWQGFLDGAAKVAHEIGRAHV